MTLGDSTSSWLRFLFGLDPGEVPAGSDARFELTGMWRGAAGWLAFFLIAGAAALIVALYRRERELGGLQRACLAGLRLLALAVVIWMLLDPRILTEVQLKRDAHTFVCLDTSGSMSTADTFEGAEQRAIERATGLHAGGGRETRLGLALAALEHEKVIERLAEKNRVRSFGFDKALRSVDKFDAASVPAAAGEETRLGDALRSVLKQAGPDPIAGIVVLSDGRSNAGDTLDKAAAEVALRGVPVYAVGAGRTKEPRNYAVTQLSGPDVAVPGFPIRLEARVEVSGLRGPVTVTLSRQPVKGGTKEKVEDRKVEGKSLKYATSLVFVNTIPRNGTYRYTLSIPRHPEETDPSDNQRAAQVTVADEKCRVLLVSGGPTLEYRRLRDFLVRDDGLQVSCWLSSADSGYPQDGDVVIRELPQGADKLRPYDAVLLLDPDARTLGEAFVEGLKDFVLEQGGGLAYVAGEYFFQDLAASERFATLRAILPVEAGSAPARPGSHAYTRAWRPALTRQGAEHPLCRLEDDPVENAKKWAELPGLYYNASIQRLKPAASSLLEKEGGDIIAAVHRAGAGYTVFLGTDDLHRWRSEKESIHDRFWGAVVRYLALGKKVSGTGEVTLHAARDRYAAGEDVEFEASLTDVERKPVIKERLEVSVELTEAQAPENRANAPVGTPVSAQANAGRTRMNLLPVSGRPGWYAGRFRPESPGRYIAQITGQIDPEAGKASFAVVSPTTEYEDPSPDPAALEELARRTGGAFFSLAEIGQVPERIEDRSVTEVIGRTASTLWDSSAILLLFCALLIAEWTLRKLWRLN